MDRQALSTLLWELGDTPEGATPARLRDLAAQLEGQAAQLDGQGAQPAGQQPAPASSPAGSFTELLQQVPDLQAAAAAAHAAGDPLAARDLVWDLADRINATADQHLREQMPHLYDAGPRAATDDAGLQELKSRVYAAHADPGGVGQDELERLVESYNQTVEGIRTDHEREADNTERQRQAAERARNIQQRQEEPLVKELERLLKQRAGR